MVLFCRIDNNNTVDSKCILSASMGTVTPLLLWISSTAVYTRKVEMVTDIVDDRLSSNVR